jgi:hypothetical protein
MTIFIQTEKPVYHQSQIGKKTKSNQIRPHFRIF